MTGPDLPSPPARRLVWIRNAVLVAAIGLFAARALHTAAVYNHTFDEPTQLRLVPVRPVYPIDRLAPPGSSRCKSAEYCCTLGAHV